MKITKKHDDKSNRYTEILKCAEPIGHPKQVQDDGAMVLAVLLMTGPSKNYGNWYYILLAASSSVEPI